METDKRVLLGRTMPGKRKKSGEHKVNPKKIQRGFRFSTSVFHAFCSGCGIYSEVSEKIARKYLKENYPDTILKGMYIESSQCELCESEKKETEFFLKKGLNMN